MNRSNRIWLSLLAVLGLIIVGTMISVRSPRPHNILLITLDTTRADRLGCYGYRLARTPTLDQLAEHGVLFERAYAPVPLTLPSHASMLTGLYPPEHGLHNNGQAALSQGIPTLATELQAAGYETGAFVAAFVLNQKFGLNRGFQTYNDDLSQADPSLHGHHQYREGSLVIDAALKWLQPRESKPFFCWVHLFDPHYPYLLHEDRFENEFAGRPYDAELAYVDAQINRLLSSLKKSGTLDHTTIVVVGDHGESLGEHGELTHSMTLYDAALRVPLLIAPPGKHAPGRRIATPVSLVDLAPTLLDQLKLKPLPQASGRSLNAALQGDSIAETPCYAETDEPYHVGRWSPLQALITERWKYIRSPRPELYDRHADPQELQNLASDSPEMLQKLEGELKAWEERMHQRLADSVMLTEQERRSLSSLGYASQRVLADETGQPLRDVKDMLPYYYQVNDASAMMDAGQYELAEPVLREVLAVDSEYFMAHGELGRCLLRLNRLDEAVVHLRRCVEINPEAEGVRAMLGAGLLMQNNSEEAIAELEAALRLDPTHLQSRYNLGLALEKLQRTAEAVAQYEGCLEQAPEFLPARQRLQALSDQLP